MSNYFARICLGIAALTGDLRGVTSLEYALIAATTVAVTAGGMVAINPSLANLWGQVAAAMAG
jgi:Flp pilus assembly pilin Flp